MISEVYVNLYVNTLWLKWLPWEKKKKTVQQQKQEFYFWEYIIYGSNTNYRGESYIPKMLSSTLFIGKIDNYLNSLK